MSRNANVQCRCWDDGLCHPPAAFTPFLRYDSATAGLDLRLPDDMPDADAQALFAAFERWCDREACLHENMFAASELIGSSSEIAEFVDALQAHDEVDYTPLIEEVAHAKEDLTPPDLARTCLPLLDRFAAVPPFGLIIRLVDSDTGNEELAVNPHVVDWIAGGGANQFYARLTPDCEFRVEQGLKRSLDEPEILFRSRHFSQTEMPSGDVMLTDMATGARFFSWYGRRNSSGIYPTLKVMQCQDYPVRYAHCINALRRVFRASIETGHPVRWG